MDLGQDDGGVSHARVDNDRATDEDRGWHGKEGVQDGLGGGDAFGDGGQVGWGEDKVSCSYWG